MRAKLFILLLILFCSCGSKGQEDAVNSDSVIRIDLLSEPKSTITKLSDFANNVEYIPLQTTNNSLLGEFALKVVSVDDRIYIRNSGIGGEIMCFDIDGKFLFKLREFGRGPAEYTSITDFDVSTDNKILTVLSNVDRKLFVYNVSDTETTFEKAVSLNNPFPMTIGLVPETNYAFIAVEPRLNNTPALSILINVNGDTIYIKPNCYGSRQEKSMAYFRSAIVYSNESKLCFREYFSDTVFYVDMEEKSFKPRIIFDTGGTLFTPEMVGNPERVGDNVTNFSGIYETSRYIFYYYSQKNSYNCLIFDKKTKTSYKLDTGSFTVTRANIPGTDVRIKFQDDLSGGPDFTQDIRYLNMLNSDGKMFSLVDAISFKKFIEGEEFKNNRISNPEKKDELIEIANSLKETDNPVLVVVTPKKLMK